MTLVKTIFSSITPSIVTTQHNDIQKEKQKKLIILLSNALNMYILIEQFYNHSQLSAAGTHGALIHPPANWFESQMRFHAEKATLTRLQTLLEKAAPGKKLFYKLKATVFGRFIDFFCENWEYKGRLIAFLYFHMVYPDCDDELHFKVGDNRVKFGKREFGMIMGYKFGNLNVELPQQSMCFAPTCELSKCTMSVTLEKIEAAFRSNHNHETVYRMGLVYLIYGLIIGSDPGVVIPSQIFYIVEDLRLVETFPWGEYLFRNLIWNWRKIVHECKVLGPRVDRKSHKPQVTGCLYALQLWSFHTMPRLTEYGKYVTVIEEHADALPSILRWKCSDGGVYYKTLVSKTVSPWDGMVDDILITTEDRRFVISLGLLEAEVTAPPRVLPIPPVIAPPPVNVPARAPGSPVHGLVRERPKIDDEDVRGSQYRRVDGPSTSANPQGNLQDDIGDGSIPIVGSVRLESLMPVFTRIVQKELEKTNSELREMRTELSEVKIELGETKAELSISRTELSEVKAELSEVKAEVVRLRAAAAATTKIVEERHTKFVSFIRNFS